MKGGGGGPPPMVPTESGPKIWKLKSYGRQRHRSKILLPSEVHLGERLTVSQSVS